jgi:hypothetical protein
MWRTRLQPLPRPYVLFVCSSPVLLLPLLGEFDPGCWVLPTFRRVSSSGVSAPSVLSLMVPEYQMSGGVSTAAAVPLHGFLPVDGVGWWCVGPDVLEDVIIISKGGLSVR